MFCIVVTWFPVVTLQATIVCILTAPLGSKTLLLIWTEVKFSPNKFNQPNPHFNLQVRCLSLLELWVQAAYGNGFLSDFSALFCVRLLPHGPTLIPGVFTSSMNYKICQLHSNFPPYYVLLVFLWMLKVTIYLFIYVVWQTR